MKVLSLFDGISAGQLALQRAGIKVSDYYAAEIDKFAIQITQKNFPNTIQLGDVSKIKGSDLPTIDLLLGGSPCQSFSKAGNQKGFDGTSGLFWQYVRILEEVKPEYFLLENVQMKKEWEDIITAAVGVQPIRINSRLVSGQNRPRVYWTNIPNVTQPEDKGILLKDIVQPMDEIEEKFLLSTEALDYMIRLKNGKPRYESYKNEFDGKAACLTANMYKGVPYGVIRIPEATKKGYAEINPNEGVDLTYINSTTRRGRRMEDKSNCLTAIPQEYCWYDGYTVRKLTPVECERLQTFPDGYTEGVSNSQRYKALGNSFTVDIIAHILKNLT